MSDKAAIDTNIIIYLYDEQAEKKSNIAARLLTEEPLIPSQVISECLNTLRRLLPMNKEDLLMHLSELFEECDIIPTQASTLRQASLLSAKYQFQLFDALVVAAALEAGCSVLYSEDMQHGLLVNNSLRIINPFIR